MSTFHLDHDGDDYRIEISDGQFKMLQQAADGTWNVEAQMSVRAAEILASLGPVGNDEGPGVRDAESVANRGRLTRRG